MALFSGNTSRPFWNWINRRNGKTWSVCYSIGCYLQQIEGWVHRRGRRRESMIMIFEVDYDE